MVPGYPSQWRREKILANIEIPFQIQSVMVPCSSSQWRREKILAIIEIPFQS